MSSAHISRTYAAYVLMACALVAGVLIAQGMHDRANARPVQARWRRQSVTIDDPATVLAAQQWGAPFQIRYAAKDADIHVERVELGGRAAGEATPTIVDGVIVGCLIEVEAGETVAILAHEVGHCLGLMGHAMTPTSLMHKETGRPGVSAVGVTDADRAALESLYAGAR